MLLGGEEEADMTTLSVQVIKQDKTWKHSPRQAATTHGNDKIGHDDFPSR
jgi:hypothetical protein